MMASAASRWLDTRVESKDIARQMKGADLASSIRKQLVGPNGAADHLINIFRRLIFAVDLLVLPVGKLGRHEACMPVRAQNWSGGIATGATLLPVMEVLSDWVSMSHLLGADGQLLRELI